MAKRLTDEEIIAALILKGSIKGAAASLNCTVRTLYDRMRKEEFKTLYSQAKGELVRSATAKMQGHLCGAIDTIAAIMNDPEAPKQTRLNGAVSILQYASKYLETTEILDRLEDLEKAVGEGRP